MKIFLLQERTRSPTTILHSLHLAFFTLCHCRWCPFTTETEPGYLSRDLVFRPQSRTEIGIYFLLVYFLRIKESTRRIKYYVTVIVPRNNISDTIFFLRSEGYTTDCRPRITPTEIREGPELDVLVLLLRIT